MGNCVCMQGLGRGGSKKRAVSSGGGDSVKPFLENAATVHPLAAESADEDKKVPAAGESKVVRLKVVLTKAEAALLLASGTIASSEKMSPAISMLEQLAAELEKLGSANRAHSEQVGCGSCAWRPALESIPEVM